jgi:lipopolysaccharide transport system permease protein
MTNAANRALPSIIANAALIKKIYVPKYIFTLAAVSSEFVSLIFSLIAFLIVAIITKVHFTWYFLLTVIPLLELYIFCIGLGLILASAMVFFRDVQHIWGVLSAAWMYLTPIFYPISLLPDWLRPIVIGYNPMYFFITQFRDFTLNGTIGTISNIWLGALAAVLMFFLGLLIFVRTKNKFILFM